MLLNKKSTPRTKKSASLIKIETENGRVRYGTLEYGIVGKFGSPPVKNN
jgi:hypothetical protein